MPQLTKPSASHDVEASPVIAEGLTAKFNGTTALEDISFELDPSQLVGVVGPNGAGKTTLFKIIAGILKPTTGTVQIHGHQPGRHICVAYVPQRSQVDWEFPVSVNDVVMMGRVREMGLFRWPRKVDRETVRAALDQVGMAQHCDRQIGELSGGQQQRVFLAQAVAQEARIVLLDEPLSGLDVPSQEAILEILDKMRAQGVTVLVATHDLNFAAERMDSVLLLNRSLISFGPPQQAFARDFLLEAYGGKLHFLPGEEAITTVADKSNYGDE